MNDEIARAIQSAKYNESVQVFVKDEEGNSYEVSLISSLDEENGGIQWNSVQTVANEVEEALRRHLRTKRWIFPMLNDHRRNELYARAIQRAAEVVSFRCNSNHDDQDETKTTTTAQALDIGSGTGLLAMLSAKHLTEKMKGESVHVTSLEMSSAMAKIARATVASNAMQESITVIEGHSCEIPPLQPKALLCTSELLESGLLGEGWIPAMRDAWERHLHPMAVVVPQRAKVFAQLVEGPGVFNFWGPYQKLSGFPNSRSLSLSLNRDCTSYLVEGTGVQVPVHLHKLLADIENPIRILSDPIEVLEIRVDSKETIPTVEGQMRSTTIVPTASGVAHGLVFWWELHLFGNYDDLVYNTIRAPWQDHWHQCIFAFATNPDDCPRVHQGEPITIQTTHNDYALSFVILPGDYEDGESKKQRSMDDKTGLLSPQRAWQLNDLSRSDTIRDGILALLNQKGFDAVILDVSDFSLCAMMAGLLGGSNVWSLEAGSDGLATATARIAQVANGLPLPSEGPKSNLFQILRCHPEQVTTEVLGGSPVDIVVAEPYYEILEGWALLEALNFLYILRGLKKRGVLRPDILTLPLYAKVWGCAFESTTISQSYSKCNGRLCDFSHEVINNYHALHEYDVSLPSWQYDIMPLSDPFEIATLDYMDCMIKQNAPSEVAFSKSGGTCHGMLVWIEYGIPATNPSRIGHTLSTQGRSHYQMIRLLKEPADNIDHKADAFLFKASFGRCDKVWDDVNFEISVRRERKIPG